MKISAVEWLRSRVQPRFKPGHTLLPLSRYGYNGQVDWRTRVELCNWGYALGFGQEATPAKVAQIDVPGTEEFEIAAVARSNPAKYGLEVLVSYRMPAPGEVGVPEETWVHNAAGQRVNLYGEPTSAPVNGDNKPIFSPIAPSSVWELAGEYRAAPLRDMVAKGVPISVVLDGGERGLPVWGWGQYSWPNDPAIVAAKNASGLNWMPYCSWVKGEAEKIIFDKIKAAVPGNPLVSYFGADEGALRNAWTTTPPYIGDASGFWYRTDIKKFIDIPTQTFYYSFDNALYNSGFVGVMDGLTQMTNAYGLQISQGEPFTYGWSNPDNPGPREANFDRWIGFMRCWYFLGLLGHVFGYWYFPPEGYNAPFEPNSPPSWLRFMAVHGNIHAQFSWYEDFIRNSDLLPGPNRHRVSVNDPAYELPTGDPNARVLARKHKTRNEWMLIAWAADGSNRTVRINVPGLGRLALTATPRAKIYKV